MAIEEIRRTPPYGPAKGMLEGLRLLQRTAPTVVDQELLRANNIARGNEYKVVGALRFLGLVDEAGRPTDRARMLKTRGPLLQLNLQTIVREAYPTLFRKLDLKTASRDDVYNHFLVDLGLQPEMAAKATRFFLELARAAQFTVGAGRPEPMDDRVEVARRVPVSADPLAPQGKRVVRLAARGATMDSPAPVGPSLTISLPSEALAMSEEDLTAFFGRVVRAWRAATA